MDEDSNTQKIRPKFGNRLLTDEDSVFSHNAWDNVKWNSELEEEALKKVEANSSRKVNDADKEKFEKEANHFWDAFYGVHQNKFFKDRQWLFTEFPELDISKPSDKTLKEGNVKIFEIGCGVGNTIFPILQNINTSDLFIYGCDFSEAAVNLLKEHPLYDEARCCAFVCDVTSDDWEAPFPECSLDIVILIFVLSAISPKKFSHVIRMTKKYLKPGGIVLFRDYGRYDLAQLRFKNGQCISENFYVRGDGTRVYFFTQEEVHELFVKEGFSEEQNSIDRRLQVNRGKMLKMYRVWIQGKYRKEET